MQTVVEQKIRELARSDRDQFKAYLATNKLPQVAVVSRLCRAGLLVQRSGFYVPVSGCHQAMADVLARPAVEEGEKVG